MGEHQCEWCEAPAVVSVTSKLDPTYVRYACADPVHQQNVERLAQLDGHTPQPSASERGSVQGASSSLNGGEGGKCSRCGQDRRPVTSRTPEGAWKCGCEEPAPLTAEELASIKDSVVAGEVTESVANTARLLATIAARDKRIAWLESGDVHTCHDECPRIACAQDREITALKSRCEAAENQLNAALFERNCAAKDRDAALKSVEEWKAKAEGYFRERQEMFGRGLWHAAGTLARMGKNEEAAAWCRMEAEKYAHEDPYAERDLLAGHCERLEGALEDIKGGHWIEGIKQRGPYLGYTVEEIAFAAISARPHASAIAKIEARAMRKAAEIAKGPPWSNQALANVLTAAAEKLEREG